MDFFAFGTDVSLAGDEVIGAAEGALVAVESMGKSDPVLAVGSGDVAAA